jgi:hypothetical protein
MTGDATTSAPDDFVGKHLVDDFSSLPLMILTKPDEEKTVYGYRFEPRNCDEADAFHEGGAVTYELYVICSRSGEIEQVNHRVEPSGCGGRSFAPQGAPAWMFPAGAMFDIEWNDIVENAQGRMLHLLDVMTASPR